MDILQNVFEDNETGLIFKPHLNKVKSTFYEARHSVEKKKKRILTETSIHKQRNNKANANKNENTSFLINIAQEDDSNIVKFLQNL